MRGKIILTSILILVLGALLRLSNLNSLPVFADESIYVRWSQVMAAVPTLRFLPLSDGKQPLYMWLLMPVLKVVPDPLIAGRVLSGILDLGSCVFLGLLAYFLFKKPTAGLFAGLIWATAPYSVFFGRMALADSTLTFFIISGVLFAYLSLSRLRWDFSMVSGILLGLAWLTKSPAMLILLLLPLLVFLAPSPKKNYLIIFFLFSNIYILAFGIYQILRLGPEYHMIGIRNRDYIWDIHEVLKHPLDPLIPHLRDSFQFFFYYLNPIILILIFFNYIQKKNYSYSILLLTFFWLIPIFGQSFIAKTLTARYLLYTLPFAVLLASKSNHKLLLVGIGLNLLLVFQLIHFPTRFLMPRIERAGYLEEWTAGYGIKDVANYLQKIDSPVVVGSEGFFGTPFSALEMYLNHKKNIRIVGVGVYINSVSDKLTNAKNDNQVFLVVNSSRLHTDYQNLSLQLLAAYPKAIRPDGKREYLYFFKVL